MKNTTKIILAVGASLAGYSIYKMMQLKQAIGQLSYEVIGIRKGKINWNDISVSAIIDVRLINPSKINIALNGAGLVKVKRIAIFNATTKAFIGDGVADITALTLNAESTADIKNIRIFAPIASIVGSMDVLSQYNFDLFDIQMTIEAFGKDYIINS